MLIPAQGKILYSVSKSKSDTPAPGKLYSEYAGIEKYLTSGLVKATDLWELKQEEIDSIPKLQFLNSVLLDVDVQKYLDNGKMSIHFVISHLEEFRYTIPQPGQLRKLNLFDLLKMSFIQQYIDNGLLSIHALFRLSGAHIGSIESLVEQMSILEMQERIHAATLASIQRQRLFIANNLQSRL